MVMIKFASTRVIIKVIVNVLMIIILLSILKLFQQINFLIINTNQNVNNNNLLLSTTFGNSSSPTTTTTSTATTNSDLCNLVARYRDDQCSFVMSECPVGFAGSVLNYLYLRYCSLGIFFFFFAILWIFVCFYVLKDVCSLYCFTIEM